MPLLPKSLAIRSRGRRCSLPRGLKYAEAFFIEQTFAEKFGFCIIWLDDRIIFKFLGMKATITNKHSIYRYLCYFNAKNIKK